MERLYKSIGKGPSSERLLLFFDFCNYHISITINNISIKNDTHPTIPCLKLLKNANYPFGTILAIRESETIQTLN